MTAKRESETRFSHGEMSHLEEDLAPAGLERKAGSFFHVSPEGDGITCLVCGCVSHEPQHIEERFCPRCGVFHEDRLLMARLREGFEVAMPVQEHVRPPEGFSLAS